MKYKKLMGIFLATLVLSVSGFSATEASAAPKRGDVIIQSINGADVGIFSDKDGLWQPNESKTNSFIIRNTGKEDIKVKEFHIENKSLINYVEDKIISESDIEYNVYMENSNVTLIYNDEILYTGTFKDTFNMGDIKLDSDIEVNAGEEKLLEMKIEISSEMNNYGQNLKNEFSLGITYEGNEKEIIPPKPDPEDPNGGSGNSNGGNGNSNNQGNQNKPGTSLPQTGEGVGSVAKSATGLGILLAGALMMIKPRKKGDEK